jgi:hypothetical protein
MPENGAPGANIGNYKGVMLCNRPFAGAAAAAKTSQKTTPSFLTGKPAEKIGANVPIMKDTKAPVNRSKKHTALSRHKKWLVDLQKTKDSLEQEMLADEQLKLEKKEKFMERERKMRAAVRGVDADADADAKDSSRYAGSKYGDDEFDVDFDEGNAPAASQKKSNKPMWAMTEEKASKAQERKEEEEAEDLLDFAAGLDFDKFIDDMEVRAMMDQVKGRVDELESAIAEEEVVAGQLAAEREARQNGLTEENLNALDEDYTDEDQQRDDDLISMAESMLSETGLGQTYSKQAMKEKIAQVKRNAMPAISESKDEAKGESVIEKNKRMINERSNQNRADKENDFKKALEEQERIREEAEKANQFKSVDASNSPYLHRNPGV